MTAGKKEWTYHEIPELTAVDLAEEAATLTEPYEMYRIVIDNHVEAAQVVYVPEAGRIGIAWGADADWADSTGSIEQDLDDYVHGRGAWGG